MEISEIITAIGVIIMGWFAYNQKTKDKMTDLKIKMIENDAQRKSRRRSRDSAKIYGEIWELLHYLNADRVYIIQPYPLDKNHYISIEYEVTRKGITGMKEYVYKIPMSQMAVFSRDMSENQFLYISNINEQVKDKKAQALLSSNGGYAAIIKRMTDGTHDWIGSIICEFTHKIEISEEEARKLLRNAATNIQYILPEYHDPEDLSNENSI